MKKNNFRFTSSKFHTNHLESPLNNFIDQTTKNIFGSSFTEKNKKEFLYATIWLDQVRIGTLKTEITFENNVNCYFKPRLEFASSYQFRDLLNFIPEIVSSFYNSSDFEKIFLIYGRTSQGKGKLNIPRNEKINFKELN